MIKIKSQVANTIEDVYEYVDDAVGAVEHAMRKQERKWVKYEGKVEEVEKVVVKLRNTTHMENGSLSTDLGAIQTSVRSMIGYIIPAWLTTPPTQNLVSVIFSPPALFSAKPMVAEPKRYPMRTLSGSSSPSTPLETIFEDEPISNSSYPLLLAWPYLLISSIVYRTGHIVTLPVRAVVRMLLRNH